MKDLLGGKGSGLAEMTNAGLPVPPGFTISTRGLHALLREQGQAAAGDRAGDARATSRSSSRRRGAKLGSPTDPLLVSVRSGAKFSMPGMMDTILNLGLNDVTVEGAQGADGERPLRVRQLPPLHPDVRQRRARDPEGGVRARVRGRQEGEGREARSGSRRGGAPRRRRRATRASSRTKTKQGLSAGSARAARGAARRRVPLVAEPARQGIPPHLRDSRSHRHGRQRAGDGLRQHRRSVGHGRRLHAQSGDRREGVLRRVPDQRAGRGRRRRHPHAEADPRARAR